MAGKALILDANILIRAVLGRRVRMLMETYAGRVTFVVPQAAFEEAQEHLPTLAAKHSGDPDKILAVLHALTALVDVIEGEAYASFEMDARERLADRDPEDWPILAAALAFGCPIWTEDSDFFGCGVPTWTSSRVEIFLRGRSS